MLKRAGVPVWRQMPVIRVLIPFILGILLQWYLQFVFWLTATAAICFGAALLAFTFLPLALKFTLRPLQGMLLNGIVLCAAAGITWQKDVRHSIGWYGNKYTDSSVLVVRIDEPPVEKAKSFKADGVVETVINGDSAFPCSGKLLLYFSKDSSMPALHYGDLVLVKKQLQPIRNTGNPGAFDYRRYALFQQTVHNVFLKPKDWLLLPGNHGTGFRQFIFSSRAKILAALQQHIGNKEELGIAEALLIGYTNDLDKDIVQAYSNTGVVHIIAISGMHLALIYVLLAWLFKRLPFTRRSKILQLILVLACLWVFALITGGSASVLRSAVMFSFIKTGQTFFKRTSVFNSLAASALVLLCYDPYYLWNVGFQLSYLAVIGIIVFQKPVYNLLYIKQKWGNAVWEMASVTIAAQILTFPICIFYFHQFPLLFLLTNLVAVPLSTAILYAEIVLIAFAWVPFAGEYTGIAVEWMVRLMNNIIIWVNRLPFAVWDHLPATALTTLLLYIAIIAVSNWLLGRHKPAAIIFLLSVLSYAVLQVVEKWNVYQQQRFIVYNVPQHRAIDIIEGSEYYFIGDSALLEDGVLQNFHLKPARIAMQLEHRKDSLRSVYRMENFILAGNKRILLAAVPLHILPGAKKIRLDMIVISKNARVKVEELATVFDCPLYIFDASNSSYRVRQWKAACDSLQLNYFVVADNGAYSCNTR